MSTHEAKELLQEHILTEFQRTTLSANPYRMALYSSTGSGKSKAALECARWYYNTIAQGQMLIACHSETARDDTWPEEIAKWLPDHPLASFNVRYCYKSLKKPIGEHFAIVILDEAHKLTMDSAEFFKNNTVGALIVLTATKPRDRDKRKLLDDLVGRNFFKLKVDDAVDLGITNDYRINLFMVDFDDVEEYVVLPRLATEPLTEYQAYRKLCARIANAKAKKDGRWIKLAYIDLMRFMANTRTKMYITKYMMDKMQKKGTRFIVFAHSKEQCGRLSEYVMHSDTDDRYYQAFKAGEIDHLISIKQIQEGANIPNVGRAINIQLDSNPLNIIQKTGRLLRLEIGQMAAVNIPVFRGSFDEIWADKALKEFSKSKITRHETPRELYWKDEPQNDLLFL